MPKRTLRSSNALLLQVPRFKNKILDARTFAYSVASLFLGQSSVGNSCY